AGLSTGNFGLLDTQSGLRWVQREIRNFGGDPSKVVIHGQSSGAMLVELHLVMPGSRSLLAGLVSQSGGLSASALASGLRTSRAIGRELGCDPKELKACLQRAPGLNLTSKTYAYSSLALQAGAPMWMVLGTQCHLTYLRKPQSVGQSKQVRTGAVGALVTASVLQPLAVADYQKKQVQGMVGHKALHKALELYPVDHRNLVQNVNSLGSLSSDRNLCDIRRRLSLVNKFHPGHAYMYRFNYYYQSNANCSAEPNYHPSFLGSVHEDEVTFVMGQPIFMFQGACCGRWGSKLQREPCEQIDACVSCWNPDFGEGYHAYFDEKEWAFSQLVGGFWATFAAKGSPNGDQGVEAWPRFEGGEPVTKNIVLDADLPGQHATE
ncbi:unnamed protein product, partial [Polarella glacialis]